MAAILYAEDFKRWPSATLHLSTKNKTWLEMAGKYKTMGVQNHSWHLAILNPRLMDLDPFDTPNLTELDMLQITIECHLNPWYFFREIQLIPARAGGGTGYFEANRGNLAVLWSVFNYFITYNQQIRQTGKSLTNRVIVNWFHNVGVQGAQHLLYTKSDLVSDEIKGYKELRKLLPDWMWYLDKKDKDNQREFTTERLKNYTKTYIPANDELGANNVGRGVSPTLIQGDEIPFCNLSRVSIPAMVAASGKSFMQAEELGAFRAIMYSTTAGDLSTKDGEYVYTEIKKRAMFFSEILFDARNRAEAVDIIAANGGSRLAPNVDITFNHLQLGLSDEWLRKQLETVRGSKDKKVRDLLNQWTYGSSSNPIPERYRHQMRASVTDKSVTKREEEDYLVRWHVPEEKCRGRESVMGLDLSNAINRDSITGVLIDAQTTEVLMCFSVSETNLHLFAKWLLKWFIRLPLMTLVPESKLNWQTILDYLLIAMPAEKLDPGRRIYSRIVDNHLGDEGDKRRYRDYSTGIASDRKYRPYRPEFGFPTNNTLRDILFNQVLKEAYKTSSMLVRDPILVDELASLVEKNGRVDHNASGHDDHVISWLIAHWFLRYARNTRHYGLDDLKIMSQLRWVTSHDSDKARQAVKEAKKHKEIAEVRDKIDNAKSLLEVKYLTQKLLSMEKDLMLTENTVGSGNIDRHRSEQRDNAAKRNLLGRMRPAFGKGFKRAA